MVLSCSDPLSVLSDSGLLSVCVREKSPDKAIKKMIRETVGCG